MTKAEELEVKRQCIREAMAADPKLSERELAERCNCSWDLVKAVKFASGAKSNRAKLLVSQLKCDHELQMRALPTDDYADELAEKLKEEPDLELPDVIVFEDADGFLWVADGFTRKKAYHLAGRDRIPVKVHKGSRRDAWLFALAANETHGQRRTIADRRKAVAAALSDPELETKVAHEIAKICGGVSLGMIQSVKDELEGKKPEASAPKRQTVELDDVPIDDRDILPMKSPAGSKVEGGARSSAMTADRALTPAPEPEQPPAEPVPAVVQDDATPAAVPGTVPAAEPPRTGPPAKIEGAVADHFGKPVPDGLLEVFQDVTEFRSIIQAIGQLKTRVELLRARPGGEHLPSQHVVTDLENAQSALKAASPHVICPECRGAGCRGDAKKTRCRGHGWIHQAVYGHLTFQQKEACGDKIPDYAA